MLSETNTSKFLTYSEQNITRVESYRGDNLKLLCLDKQFSSVTWTKKNKRIFKKSSTKSMKSNILNAVHARVFVNYFGELEIRGALFSDASLYSCYVDKQLIVTIGLVVNATLFNRGEVEQAIRDKSFEKLNTFLISYMNVVSVIFLIIIACELINDKPSEPEILRKMRERENFKLKRFVRENMQLYKRI